MSSTLLLPPTHTFRLPEYNPGQHSPNVPCSAPPSYYTNVNLSPLAQASVSEHVTLKSPPPWPAGNTSFLDLNSPDDISAADTRATRLATPHLLPSTPEPATGRSRTLEGPSKLGACPLESVKEGVLPENSIHNPRRLLRDQPPRRQDAMSRTHALPSPRSPRSQFLRTRSRTVGAGTGTKFRPVPYSTKAELDSFFGQTPAQKRAEALRTRDEHGRVWYDSIEQEEWRHLLSPGSPANSSRRGSEASGYTSFSPRTPNDSPARRRGSGAFSALLEEPSSAATTLLQLTMEHLGTAGSPGIVSPRAIGSISAEAGHTFSPSGAGAEQSALTCPSLGRSLLPGPQLEGGNLDLDAILFERQLVPSTPLIPANGHQGVDSSSSSVEGQSGSHKGAANEPSTLPMRRTRQKRSDSAVQRANTVADRLPRTGPYLPSFSRRKSDSADATSAGASPRIDQGDDGGLITLPAYLPLPHHRPSPGLLDEAFNDGRKGRKRPPPLNLEAARPAQASSGVRLQADKGPGRPRPLSMHTLSPTSGSSGLRSGDLLFERTIVGQFGFGALKHNAIGDAGSLSTTSRHRRRSSFDVRTVLSRAQTSKAKAGDGLQALSREYTRGSTGLATGEDVYAKAGEIPCASIFLGSDDESEADSGSGGRTTPSPALTSSRRGMRMWLRKVRSMYKEHN